MSPIADALHDPSLLDAPPIWWERHVDVDGAAWRDGGRSFVASADDPDDETWGCHLLTYDVDARAVTAVVRLAAPTGALHRLPGRGLLALYEHPRLLDPATGAVLQEWPQLRTGTQRGAIHRGDPPPTVAVHPTRPWFAVVTGDRIGVVQLDD